MIGLACISSVGGSGKTSSALTLGQMLSDRGRTVVLIDADPANALSSFLAEPDQAQLGLVDLLQTTHTWEEVIRQEQDSLFVLPFGQCDQAVYSQWGQKVAQNPMLIAELLEQSKLSDDTIVLFDTARLPCNWALAVLALSDLNLAFLVPDSLSLLSIDSLGHALLSSKGASYFLMNRFKAEHVLHLDIWTMSKVKLSHRLIPFYLHEDQSLPEAMASGVPVHEQSPSSLLVDSFHKLTNWLDSEIEANR